MELHRILPTAESSEVPSKKNSSVDRLIASQRGKGERIIAGQGGSWIIKENTPEQRYRQGV